jgi:hypothetical protein
MGNVEDLLDAQRSRTGPFGVGRYVESQLPTTLEDPHYRLNATGRSCAHG